MREEDDDDIQVGHRQCVPRIVGHGKKDGRAQTAVHTNFGPERGLDTTEHTALHTHTTAKKKDTAHDDATRAATRSNIKGGNTRTTGLRRKQGRRDTEDRETGDRQKGERRDEGYGRC